MANSTTVVGETGNHHGRQSRRAVQRSAEAVDYEFIADKPSRYRGRWWPEIDETVPLGLCYASGPTGNPKGVEYEQPLVGTCTQPHPQCDERPVALVVLDAEAPVDAETILDHCATGFAKWQLPDDILFVDSVPLI